MKSKSIKIVWFGIVGAIIISLITSIMYIQNSLEVYSDNAGSKEAVGTVTVQINYNDGSAGPQEDIDIPAPIIQTAEGEFTNNGIDIVKNAVYYLGYKYDSAQDATQPNNGNAVDCSGLVQLALMGENAREGSNYSEDAWIKISGLFDRGGEYKQPRSVRNWLQYYDTQNEKEKFFSETAVYYLDTNSTSEKNDDVISSAYPGENNESIYERAQDIKANDNKVNILKINNPIGVDKEGNGFKWYHYYDANGNKKTLPTGTIVCSYAGEATNHQIPDAEAHMWIAIGDLGTADVNTAITKMKEMGILPSDYDNSNNYIYAANDYSTYWMIESSPKKNVNGVQINNCDPAQNEVTGGKATGSIWAYQVARGEVEKTGSFNINLVKYLEGTNQGLDGAEFKVTIPELNYTETKTTENGGNIIFNGTDGNGIAIKGENETYNITLEEITPPDGYIGKGAITFTVTTKLVDSEYKLVPSEGELNVDNARKVVVNEGEILIEAENRTTTIDIHKGVKTVENQDSGYYADVNSDTYNDLIVYTGAANAAKVLTEEELTKAVNNSDLSDEAKQNMLVIIPELVKLQDKYKINALFAVAVARVESNCGTSWENIDSSTYNWLNVKARENEGYTDKNGNVWATYSNFTEATEDWMKLITESDYYFKAGKNTIKQIAPEYCDDEWGDMVYTYMIQFYENAGITVVDVSEDPTYEDETTGREYTKIELEDMYHDWVVETTIPEEVSKYKKYVVTDPIDITKLDFSGLDRVKVELIDSTGKVTSTLTKDEDYQADYNEESGVLTITYIDEKKDEPFHGTFLSEGSIISNTAKIRLTFNTTFKVNPDTGKLVVLDGAVTNAENKSTLTYDNGNGQEISKDSEIPEVHTGAISLFKYEDTNGNKKHDEGEKALVGAEFKIALSEADAKAGNFIKIDGKELTAVSNKDGIATFIGLSFGGDAKDDEENLKNGLYKYDWEKASRDYYIVETKTPAGYEKLTDVLKVTVSKNSSEIIDLTDKINEMDSVGNKPLKFDLALRKWVTTAYVTENGQTVEYKTGHKAEDDPEDVVKVDLKKSKINNVTVKFKYSIRITNEGEIAGEAREITDYIPAGLKFVKEDNQEWETTSNERIVKTRKLEGITLEPGESAEVEILLTWVNGENTMGVMTNTAEISEDYNEFGVHDIDSTPNNKVKDEDDIDDAPVMLTIKTGSVVIAYSSLGLGFVMIITGGVIMIRRKFANV